MEKNTNKRKNSLQVDEDNPVPSLDILIKMKDEFFKRNPNMDLDNLYAEDLLNHFIKDIVENGVETDNGQPEYLVKVKDRIIIFEYEEMVELLMNLKQGSGNECYPDALKKVNQLWKSIPITDY